MVVPVKVREAASDFGSAFLAVVLGLFIASGADVFAVGAEDVRAWVAAALAATLPVIVTALRSNDPRYGRGSETEAGGEYIP